MMLATTPAPTVRPPSRMAKRSFSSIAIGTIRVTSMATLSPGITISVPSGSDTTTDVTGVAKLPDGTEMVMPGDNVNLEVELIAPIAMEKGVRFAIREGGRTVGAGTVTDIVK